MNVMLINPDGTLLFSLQKMVRDDLGHPANWHSQPDGNSALAALTTLTVDVLLTDISVAGISGYELIARAIRYQPKLNVIVYSDRTDRIAVTSAIKAGAVGYITKQRSLEELAAAFKIVRHGGAAISPNVSRIMIRELQLDSVAESLAILTRREKQVFQCIEEGVSYKGISSKLNISCNTVHTHVKSIYSKLNAVNKYDALNKAKQLAAA